MQVYRPMLKAAIKLTWRNKYLWFFGLFAAILGSGGAFNLGFKNFSKVESQGLQINLFMERVSNIRFGRLHVREALSSVEFSGVVLFVVILAIVLFLFWLAVVAQGSLVYGIKEAMAKRRDVFGEVFKKGMDKFWPVLLLNILLYFSILIVWFIVGLPFMILYAVSSSAMWYTFLIIFSFLVFVPLAIVFSLVMRYALIFVVNQNKHIAEAVSAGWKLFKKNWIVSVETGLLIFLLNILSGLALVVVMVFVALPFILLGVLASQLVAVNLFWLVVVLGILTFIVFIFIYAAVWNMFVMSMWVMLFDRIKDGVVYSRVLRWAVALTSGHKKVSEE